MVSTETREVVIARAAITLPENRQKDGCDRKMKRPYAYATDTARSCVPIF
ncbi:hypothetical protein RMSM_01802 [Rhodopirellula maiorica SM1]|uniref:Uncharacterized protein n=1 Tax=Rhodopirellula maiorica SM1 TaxID=1265738 RepID=M5RPY1_9BACT|nr:hypothetical protein RMSM_01802 [Rhodopirellula maiorica SM1]